MNRQAGLPIFSSYRNSIASITLLLGFLLALAAFLYALWGWPALVSRVTCPFQVAQTEAEMVQHSLDLLRGDSFFHDGQKTGPFLLSPLSIPFFVMQTTFMKCFGGLWLAGRLISFLSYLGIALVLIWLGLRRWQKPWTFLIPAFFFLSPTWAFWATVVRVDVSSIFLNFLCLILVMNSSAASDKGKEEKLDWLALGAAGFFNALAILNKPTFVTVTAAVFLTLLLKAKWKSLFFFLFSSLGMAGLFALGIDVYSKGLWVKNGFGVSTGYDFNRTLYFLCHSFLPEAGWLTAAVIAVIVWRRVPLLWICQMIFSTLWLFSLGNSSGAENYYLDFILFGLVAVGESFSKTNRNNQKSLEALGLILMFLFSVGFYQMAALPRPALPSKEARAMKTEALDIYRMPGEHLAIDEDLPLMAGKRVWLQVHGYRELVESGQLNPKPLVGLINQKFFTTIELYDLPRQEFLPLVVEDAVKKNYSVRIRKFGRVWLFPKKRPS